MLVRSPVRWAVAVRRPDGSIYTESHPVREPSRWRQRPFVRGPAALYQAVSIGSEALRIALRETTGAVATAGQLSSTFGLAFAGAVAIFVVAPALAARPWSGIVGAAVEATVRAAALVVYLIAISRSAPAKRIFAYHGAEHESIAAYEQLGRSPTIEEASRRSPIHVRCGTSFIASFVIVAGVVFAVVPRRGVLVGAALRVLLVPVVAALAFETMRACAREPDAWWSRVLTWPGRTLQRLTTRRPSEAELEVAIAALELAVTDL